MVTPDSSESLQAGAKNQIDAFAQVRPRYETYAGTLEKILQQAAKRYAPLAIVQVRTKTIASFAEKIQRKGAQYRDPIHQFTDLCGARIITSTAEEPSRRITRRPSSPCNGPDRPENSKPD